MSDSRTAAAKAAWRRHERERAATGADSDLRVGVAASFTANTLVPFAGAALVAAGYRPEFIIAPYNQLFQTCFDPAAQFGGSCDIIVLLWRLEDLMQRDMLAYLAGDDGALARGRDTLDGLLDALERLRAHFAGTLIVGVPAFPTGAATGLYALDTTFGLGAFHRVMVERLSARSRGIQAIRLLDLDAVQREVGAAASFDCRQYYLYRQPFTDAFLFEAGDRLGRIVVASRRAPKKCVVLDCDNTLWGGIVGEDGIDGIQIGDDFPGFAFRDFQRLLLHWRSQGIFLAIATKNNEADVWEVFDKHDGMLLRREHLSAWAINWEPKPEAIPAIAKSLNIGIDSLVFIDDNPMEIAYMRAAQPDVVSVLLPEDPAEIVPFLQRLALFDLLDVTDEDRARADMMRAERDREALVSQLSREDFQRALEVQIDLSLARAEDLGRVAQLINKTNQFNLTTIRRTVEQVRDLASDPQARIYALRVADKFGDYGLTGVVIVDLRTEQRRWVIDTLLMSCRVLGRGVETALLGALAQDARSAGVETIVATFMPTKKNALAADFLPNHGFRVDGEGSWLIKVDEIPAIASFITRARAPAAA